MLAMLSPFAVMHLQIHAPALCHDDLLSSLLLMWWRCKWRRQKRSFRRWELGFSKHMRTPTPKCSLHLSPRTLHDSFICVPSLTLHLAWNLLWWHCFYGTPPPPGPKPCMVAHWGRSHPSLPHWFMFLSFIMNPWIPSLSTSLSCREGYLASL